MIFDEQKHHKSMWERFATEDPLYSILSDDDRKDGKWDLEDFFSTGEELILHELLEIKSKFEIGSQVALDFGCGVGRLTRALLKHFDEVHGVDVSVEMIKKAKSVNPDASKITFSDQSEPTLRIYQNDYFDLVMSLITLQHIPKKYVHAYLDSIIRVTKTGGLIFIQIPAIKLHYLDKPVDHGNPSVLKKNYRRVSRYIKTNWREWKMQSGAFKKADERYFLMSCFKPQYVLTFFEKRNCKVVRMREDYSTGEDFLSYDYLIRKL
jgi:ubiquinone/menaquinone biosynthesis C-methylase UbiE